LGGFYGAEKFTIDHKGRVARPGRRRRAISPEAHETFVVVPGFDGCLALYPLDEWRLTEEKLRSLPAGDSRARLFKRMLLANAADVQVDAQGRVTLPSKLIERVGLKKDALLLGSVDHIEIWDPERFEAMTDESDGDMSLEKLAQEYLS
jgi:MraZ protein